MSYKDCPVCHFPLPRELYGKVCPDCEDKIEPMDEATAAQAEVEQFIQRDHRRRTLGRMDR